MVRVESLPVPVHDLLDVFRGVATLLKDGNQRLVVGNGIHIAGRPVDSSLPISIASDRCVIGVSGHLAHMIYMIGRVGQ